MRIASLNELKTYFERGDKPTQDQFGLLLESLTINTTDTQLNINENNQIKCHSSFIIIQGISGHGETLLTTDPQIRSGVDGQKIIIVGNSDDDPIILENGRGLILNSTCTLYRYHTIYLIFSSILNSWIEIFRSGGSNSGGNFDISELPQTFDMEEDDFIAIHDGIENKKISKTNLFGMVGSSLTVQDEGINVSENVSTINFSGVDIEAVGDGTSVVNVYVPPPDYASHFNTNDGNTNAIVNDIVTTSRIIALPTTEGNPYKIGDWTNNSIQPTINEEYIIYRTFEEFHIFDETTSISVRIIDPDNTVVAENEITNINNNMSNDLNNIRINIIDYFNDSNRHKANVIVTINIKQIYPIGGRFSVEIIHNNSLDGSYIKKHENIFIDTNIYEPVINGLSITETSGLVNIKQISGVNYYDIDSSFTTLISDLDHINDRSYPSIICEIIGTEYGLSPLNITGFDLNNWDQYYSSVNNNYENTDYRISETNFFTQTTTANISARPIDWINYSYIHSTNANILVDTYTINNNNVYEDFRNETRRLESDLSTVWDSSINIDIIDSGLGLQLKNSRLIYPQEDFTIYEPNISIQPNYILLTGQKTFYSNFYHTGVSHSNGRIRFSDFNITETNLSNEDIIIELSIDGTNWFILNNMYIGGSLSHGDGCRINSGTYNLTNNQIEFTLGTGGFTDNSTGNGWGIFYKITFKDTSIGKTLYLGSFEIVNWM